MNKLTIAGTVEKTVTPIGNSDKLGELLLKIPERRKNAGGQWEETHIFVPVKVFGKALGTARAHLPKGSKCFVVGKVEGREYNGKFYTSVVAEEVFPVVSGDEWKEVKGDLPTVLDGHPYSKGAGQTPPAWGDDDIPF